MIKKIYLKRTLSIMLVSLFITSCTTRNEEFYEEVTTESITTKRQTESGTVPPEYSKNELVIRYAPHIKTEKQKEIVRERHDVIDFKKCNCKDDSIELWIFNLDIDIEDRHSEADDDSDIDSKDYNYDIPFEDVPSGSQSSPNTELLQSLIKPINGQVTVAILDTGLDYTHTTFNEKFLYRQSRSNCKKDDSLYASWDYTNNDGDIMDQNGHGTLIAEKIYLNLIESETDFQILPIKVFDRNGIATSFSLICGLQYAEDQGVNIINFSGGWYHTEIDFIKEQIGNTQNSILYVTSAGNEGINVDREVQHYPSNFSFSNIITVAGMDVDLKGLWKYSNYGTYNVDVAALGEKLSLTGSDNPSVSGTSYAVPFVTARAAQLFNRSSPLELKNYIIESGTFSESLEGLIGNPVYINGND